MKRIVRPALGAIVLLALAATPVLANHSHVKVLGNGECVLLAEGAGEDEVVLPLAVFEQNPNVVVSSTGAAHPLHVLVHRGTPGTTHTYAVYTPTITDPGQLCWAGIVND
jgi:hypothetical protein